jgi:hypothetical protein
MKRLKNCKLNGKNLNIFNAEYPRFRKTFSSLVQQVNQLKIIIFVLIISLLS